MDITLVTAAGIIHSCYPNAAYNSKNELIILRHALPGESISIDFSTLFTGGRELFRCSCGCNGCRGRILGFDHLPVRVQEFYLLHDGLPAKTLLSILDKMYPQGNFSAEE